MRKALFIVGLISFEVALLIVGLIRGERISSSPGADSSLSCIAQFPVYRIGLWELFLGAAIVALWIALWRRYFRKP